MGSAGSWGLPRGFCYLLMLFSGHQPLIHFPLWLGSQHRGTGVDHLLDLSLSQHLRLHGSLGHHDNANRERSIRVCHGAEVGMKNYKGISSQRMLLPVQAKFQGPTLCMRVRHVCLCPHRYANVCIHLQVHVHQCYQQAPLFLSIVLSLFASMDIFCLVLTG